MEGELPHVVCIGLGVWGATTGVMGLARCQPLRRKPARLSTTSNVAKEDYRPKNEPVESNAPDYDLKGMNATHPLKISCLRGFFPPGLSLPWQSIPVYAGPPDHSDPQNQKKKGAGLGSLTQLHRIP